MKGKKGRLAQSRAILGTASGEERASSAIRISRLICGQGSAHRSARNNFHYQLGLGRCIIFCSSYKAFLQLICIRKKKRLEMLFCYALLHIMTSGQLEQCNGCHTLRDDEEIAHTTFSPEPIKNSISIKMINQKKGMILSLAQMVCYARYPFFDKA